MKTKSDKSQLGFPGSPVEIDPGPGRNTYMRPFLPLSDEVVSDTGSDMFRHVICRAAFMNEMVRYGQVNELFARWGQRTGIFKWADEVASSLNGMAVVLGIKRGSKLLDPDAQLLLSHTTLERVKRRSVRKQQQFLKLFSTFCRNGSALERSVDKLRKAGFASEAMNFVTKTLGLRWPWVAFELLDVFIRIVWLRASGQHIVRNYRIEPRRPNIEIVFKSRIEESLTEARRRLNREFEEIVRPHVSALKSGKFPLEKGRRTIEQYAKWFYQVRIEGRSIRSLAAEYHSPEDRSVIQHGVKEADRLLGLSGYIWK